MSQAPPPAAEPQNGLFPAVSELVDLANSGGITFAEVQTAYRGLNLQEWSDICDEDVPRIKAFIKAEIARRNMG